MRLENDFGWEEFRVSEAREQKGLLGAGCWVLGWKDGMGQVASGKPTWGWPTPEQEQAPGVGRREFKWPGVRDVQLVIG